MVRHDNAAIRLVAPQNHVAASLTTEHKAGALQSHGHLPTRQVGRKLGHNRVYAPQFVASYSFDFDELLTGLGRDWVASITAIF